MHEFVLSADQEIWANRKLRTHGERREYWRELVAAQEGRCAYSGALLRFEVAASTRTAATKGPHPLYASPALVDDSPDGFRHVLVSTGLHDLVVRLPAAITNELRWLPSWTKLMADWARLAKRSPSNRAAFHKLIR